MLLVDGGAAVGGAVGASAAAGGVGMLVTPAANAAHVGRVNSSSRRALVSSDEK